ncbi:hypothetical protein ACWC10_25900 [Streptomyces sp. NPDC001595]|uniref:hypothetical protein n=1 Tax=Streptomyces sp. NPDC001532 TaxID=3154520 RepID=UPI00331D71B3
MNDDMKMAVAAALAGGYLLGRTKKAKLALAVGSYVAGRRFGLSPAQLVSEGLTRLQQVPQFQELSDQVRGELLQAGRTALTTAANRRLADLADSLRDRTETLTGAAGTVGERAARATGAGRTGRTRREDEDYDADDEYDEDEDEAEDRYEDEDEAEDTYRDDDTYEDEDYKDEDYEDEDYEDEEDDESYEDDEEDEEDAPKPPAKKAAAKAPAPAPAKKAAAKKAAKKAPSHGRRGRSRRGR